MSRIVSSSDSRIAAMLLYSMAVLCGMVLLNGWSASVLAQESVEDSELLPTPQADPDTGVGLRAEEFAGWPAAESSFPAQSDSPGQPLGRIAFFADVLMWNVTEGGAENWAQEITPSGTGTTLGTANLIDAPFQWNAGFRIGLDYRNDDGGDVTLYYTNFATSAHNQASGEVYSAFLGNFYVDNADGASFGPKYAKGSVDWDFSFHSIDLEAGHNFAMDQSLQFRPFVGLKAAFINQSIHSTWQNPIDTASHIYLFSSAVEDLKQDFWSIGPSFGVNGTVPFCIRENYTLAIYAAPSGAIMYGNWKFKDVYQNDGPTSISSPTPSTVAVNSRPIDGVATMARGTAGIQWTQKFARATTSVRLGYETQVWLNQMQFYSYNMGRLNNLMSLQGGTLELSIQY